MKKKRQIAIVGPWSTVQLDYKNPYIVTFWSIAYAGLGHVLLDKYIRGFILVSGEFILNALSHLNLAIFYSMTGQSALATRTIDMRWLMLYMAVYCFAIFDSYRSTIIINNFYRLAERETTELDCFNISSTSFTVINTLSPFLAAFWAAILPGAGCFLLQRMNRALFLMTLWIAVSVMAGLYPALIYTFGGTFDAAKGAVNIQWALNLPSLWFFSVYEAYGCAVENNNLYRKAQKLYLKSEYQSKQFNIQAISGS